MTLRYEAAGGALRCLRAGRLVPADGRLGVFDILSTTEETRPGGCKLTFDVPLGGRRPVVSLPPGAELTYADTLRLAYEQNEESLNKTHAGSGKHLSPLLLPVLRHRLSELQAAAKDEAAEDTARAIRQQLADLYLF
jgi:hypothetical protein